MTPKAKHRKDEIAEILLGSGGVSKKTYEQVMTERPGYAIEKLEGELERRKVELEYHYEATPPLSELWEWMYGEEEEFRKGKHGPIPVRRRQAIQGLALHEHIGLPWKEVVNRLGLKPHQQKSLENTVSQLRKVLHQNNIEFGSKPPRKTNKSRRSPQK